ncbi:eukaryotic translation initiation factor 4G-like isoform X2 [Silene latifolia]|uniref:eukaryotic translation initiation factor 4G-like isoform X2 n=1 Tax=Silene latifolia TaxID=37657 RepID=UPI003D77348B
MSQNQLKGDKKELQYRKTGVVGGGRHNNSSDYQQRPLSGGSGTGTASSLSSNAPASRSFKKPNNGQGGHSRGNYGHLNSSSDPNPTTGPRPVENGSHVQSSLSGVSHKPAQAAIPKSDDTSSQKSSQPVPKTLPSQPSSMTSDSTLPSTPSKGDAGKGFSLQFGSISPGFMNVMAVPARTSSAPPKLDEQQQNQAMRSVSRASAANPAPSAPKQQTPNMDCSTEKPTPQEPRVVSKVTREVPVASAPSPVQTQKPTVVPVAGISMPMPFTQPTGPISYGGPNPQMPSGMRANSHQMPIQMPLPMGNPTQIQPPVFVPGLQPHLMPNQGMIHPGQNFGFSPQLAHQLPHQPGSLGMNVPPQVNQQAGKFGSARKTVKITHPETHEELTLDDKNGGSPGSRVTHVAHPPYTAARPGSFYSNSYTPGSPFTPPPSSVPLTNTSLAPRFNYTGQGPPVMPYVNQAGSTSISINMGVASMPGRPESFNLDSARSAPHVRPSTHSLSATVPVTIKPAVPSAGDSSVIGKADSGISLNVQKETVIDKETPMASQDQPSTEVDSHLQSVTKQGETNHSKGFQSDNHLKATNIVTKPEQPDEKKKTDREASALEAAVVEATTAVDAGIEEEIMEDEKRNVKYSVEPNKVKNNKGKKKRKEMFQKADALGTNPDLYGAYKGPKDHKETEESVLYNDMKEVPGAKLENGPVKKIDEQNKPELENWEDVADGSTPKLKPSDNGNATPGGFYKDDDDNGVAIKKYSRDFLLTICEQCIDLPEGFQITPDIADVLMGLNVNNSRDYAPSGRIVDRSSGVARHDRRGNGSIETDRWSKPNPHIVARDPGMDLAYGTNMMGFRPGQGLNYGVRPRGQGPVQHVGGNLPGLMHSMSFQGTQRNNFEGERWQRATNFNKGGLMPSPQPVMHRAENKYEVGKVSDEEQAKQRRLKAIFNKLTPQNFEKLFEQVKEVKIDNVVTLTGVISQIFDKALMEPTFCEMYANFCHHLASELPDLSVDNQKITFRRLLLNKCQEEFERGEREEEEVNKDEGETKQSDQEREEKRLKVRRRMLGNIRLIGELYKKRMLTERIMHECIKKLLGNYQNADEENIEALCKLMSTIGDMIDHSKAKEHIDAYFDIMRQLSNDMKLSSRVRFMLKDTIDLRKNKWQQRRKVEGPKKIEEVHKAAAQERMGQASRLNRGPSMNSSLRRGPPLEYAPRGSTVSSSMGQGGGYRGVGSQFRGQDARIDDKSEFENRTLSVPLLQRSSGDEPIMLGPQGGLAKVMSVREQLSVSTGTTADNSSFHGDARRGVAGLNGFSNLSDRGTNLSRGDKSNGQEHNSTAAQKMTAEKVYPEERLREMSMAAIKEYYSAKDVKEAELCIKELNAPGFYPTVISMWVTDAFERKDMERSVLTKLLISLTKPQEGTFSPQQLIQGFESLLTDFEETVTDAPRAPEFLGQMFGTLVLENVLPLQDVCRLIHRGGEEPGRLLEVGLAADVLGSILEIIKSEKGDATLNEFRTSSNLRLEDYLPPEPLKSRKLEMFL